MVNQRTSAAFAPRFARNVVTNVGDIKQNIAANVQRSVTVVQKSAERWQVSQHSSNAGEEPALSLYNQH